MRFSETTDDLLQSGIFSRKISENGLVHFGVYQVLYGYRIRAGLTSDKCGVNLDWCAGSEWSNVEHLYSIVQSILEKKEETVDCFDDLPSTSKIKPFNLDKPFCEYILNKAGEVPEIDLEKPVRIF